LNTEVPLSEVAQTIADTLLNGVRKS